MHVPVLIGLLAAVVAYAPRLLREDIPVASNSIRWLAPIWILGIAVVAILIQKFILDRRSGSREYDGLADLLVHLHSPATPDSPSRWSLRGLISFLLALFGAPVGPEGSAIELSHGAAMKSRPRSSRWFEQHRRTDAGMSVAAGVAAAFGAPFAAVLVAVELGIGGRAVSAVISALTAFWVTHLLHGPEGFQSVNLSLLASGFRFDRWQEWIGVLTITLLAGGAGTLMIRFFRYSQESLRDLIQTRAWIRTLIGGILLFMVAWVYREGHAPPSWLLGDVLSGGRTSAEAALLFCTQFLAFALVISAFGTIGVFWPVFALGGLLGFWLDQALLPYLGTSAEGFSPIAALAGATALWGVILGAPIAGAVLAFEMTHNIHLLLPCLIAGLGAARIRDFMRTDNLIEKDLESRGITLIDGRSSSVLGAIQVRDAMVTDFETVHEQEPVSDIHSRLLSSRYPFLPVVNTQGLYLGLLTVDMVQEGWQAQDPLSSHSPLATLLEAKDLLYRSGFKTPTVKVNDKLTATAGIFSRVPCVPVLGDDGRVQGLLFVSNVRLAYEREVARRSLSVAYPSA